MADLPKEKNAGTAQTKLEAEQAKPSLIVDQDVEQPSQQYEIIDTTSKAHDNSKNESDASHIEDSQAQLKSALFEAKWQPKHRTDNPGSG